jgi:hypothetical protein
VKHRYKVVYGYSSMDDRSGVPVLFRDGEPHQRLDNGHPAYRDSFRGWSDWPINDRTAHAAAVSGCTGTGDDDANDDALCIDGSRRLFILHAWQHSDGRGLQGFLYVGRDGKPHCTATDAVLEGVSDE